MGLLYGYGLDGAFHGLCCNLGVGLAGEYIGHLKGHTFYDVLALLVVEPLVADIAAPTSHHVDLSGAHWSATLSGRIRMKRGWRNLPSGVKCMQETSMVVPTRQEPS